MLFDISACYSFFPDRMIKYEQLCIMYVSITIGSFKCGNLWPTVKLAVLNIETRIQHSEIYAGLLILFNIFTCYTFSRLDDQIWAIVHFLLLHA